MTFSIPIGILERRGGDAVDNREIIMQCALNLFSDKGYDSVGVQEIAKAAGITKPTLYYYFKSKHGLLEALIQEKGELLMKQLIRSVEISGGISEKLLRLAHAYVEFSTEDEKFFMLMLCLMYYPRQNEAHQAIAPLIHKQYCLITETFERESKYLGNMNGRQEQFAMGFLGTLDSYITIQYERGKSREEIRDFGAVYSVVHQFLHGIFS